MLKVLLTVDAEMWLVAEKPRERGLNREFDRDILGRTAEGEFGIKYQMQCFHQHGLKAVYFVESLCAEAVGLKPLEQVVRLVNEGGHEVQLHVHTEWLRHTASPPITPPPGHQNIREFSGVDQERLLKIALAHLLAAGAKNVCAFRAGNFGADLRTLRAVRRLGLRYDTSYNAYYLPSPCGITLPCLRNQPAEIEGLWEIPVATFRHAPGGRIRHAQIGACAAEEIESALLQTATDRGGVFVIVFHSFELLRNRVPNGRSATADHRVIRRFERICHFLASQKGKMQTVGFHDLQPDELKQISESPGEEIWVPARHTMRRYSEQFSRRLFG
jgi:hypothetical protein